jgi:hypothetical protein
LLGNFCLSCLWIVTFNYLYGIFHRCMQSNYPEVILDPANVVVDIRVACRAHLNAVRSPQLMPIPPLWFPYTRSPLTLPLAWHDVMEY